jgi:translation initiation factor IF-2
MTVKKLHFEITRSRSVYCDARGAQVTDIAIIVIAADDDIMPQTKEAISHAQAAGVPIIFISRYANPEKIKEKLAGMNLLVEDWGGKYQSHDISAKWELV